MQLAGTTVDVMKGGIDSSRELTSQGFEKKDHTGLVMNPDGSDDLMEYKIGVNQQHKKYRAPITTETLSDPIEVLTTEHVEGLEHLRRIAEAAKSIQFDGFSEKAFRVIADSVRAIDVIIHEHNLKEEACLLPLLERHATKPPGSMQLEHREIGRAFEDLRRSVADVEDGRIHGSSIRELVQLANVVVERLSRHIAGEDTLLFPTVKRLLTEEEYEQLKQEIARATTHHS